MSSYYEFRGNAKGQATMFIIGDVGDLQNFCEYCIDGNILCDWTVQEGNNPIRREAYLTLRNISLFSVECIRDDLMKLFIIKDWDFKINGVDYDDIDYYEY